ncbi:hypothetical protein B0H17DRAFT_1157051 [Mycena rosella]|uniref:Uncharacterized protein n=1 Tax=Mycena rosella TaxID=1033263 RepID=A0AAD7GRW4_MYCRO|nr:hypothetical protein B0H17DRAFT_1157051 [Mycena rosella]
MARKLGFGAEKDLWETSEDDEDDFLADLMCNIDLQEPEPDEIQVELDGHPGVPTAAANEWFPYPSKMMFLLDTLDNLPRLRISSSLMCVILWVLKEARCRETVPSFDHLRRVQKTIRAQCGISTIPCKSVQGNVFFMNDPTAIIAKDWANPTTRKMIHVYPEIPEDGIIREIWHAQKWRKNMDLDILSPMYDAGTSHYYFNEFSRLRDGRFVIPIRWVKFRGKVYADTFAVTINKEGKATVRDGETSLICSDNLEQNYYDLEQMGEIPNWGDRMPNPKRVIAGGHPFYSSFVNYFGDDVSGNRTKSWNKHWNAYITYANLPRQLLQQEFHVHFISTSPNASVSEQFHEFKVADELGNTTCFALHVNSGPSDNPMQSEISTHIGGKGNCPCRKCRMGGTQKQKATNQGYHAIFEAGEPRTKQHVIAELEKQVKLACTGVVKHVKDSQTETGEIKKEEPNRSAAEIQAELVQWTIDNRDKIYSPFLTMKAFDPTRDTPVEILHTILLGIIKYIWHLTHTPWSEEQKKMYSVRLQSSNTDGLSIHAIRSNYIMQYAGSLIGRQFKTLAQTNIFHVRGLVSDNEFMAWKAAGELSALLWFPEIRNLAEYRHDLKVAVANILDVFATIDPSNIISKIKYHLLVHMDEHVVQFGPLVGLATELFESFNAVFRYCSILSNHLAPSRDIATQLADQEGLKHRLTGVQNFMVDHPILQNLVGWTEKKPVKHVIAISSFPESPTNPCFAGDVKLTPVKRGQKEREKCSLQSTNAACAANYGLYTAASVWTKCIHVISESLDQCLVSSWVFAESPVDASSTIPGRISDILVDSTGVVVLVLEVFQILSCRDEVYGMPVLVRRYAEAEFYIVPAKNIKFKFNVQHDCRSAECDATGVRLRIQERVESDQTENYIVHKSFDRFLINTHAFHNAHLLRAVLPRDLVAPIPIFTERTAKHDELAAQLREILTTRKAAAVAKKRKRLEDGDDAGETGERPRKKKKGPEISSTELMVTNRGRRTITQTEKAKAANVESESEEDRLSSLSDEAEDTDSIYDDSEDNYSD